MQNHDEEIKRESQIVKMMMIISLKFKITKLSQNKSYKSQ